MPTSQKTTNILSAYRRVWAVLNFHNYSWWLKSKTIWLCAQCYVCSANCPQNVDFSNIMMSLRDMAVKEGYAPPDRLEKIETIGTAAHEIRKNCINLLLGEGDVSPEQIQEQLKELHIKIN